MSSVSRKRGSGDDSAPAVENDAKIRKEDEQLLREREPFDSINDIILELYSFEEYMVLGKVDAFRQTLKKLDEWAALIRRKQELDVIHMEGVTELRRLVDEYIGKAIKAKFEEQLDNIEFGSGFIRKQTANIEDSNPLLENVDIQQPEPHPQEIQADEHSFEAVQQEIGTVEASKPVIQNLLSDGDCFLSSSAHVKEPHEKDNPVSLETHTVKTNVHSIWRSGYGDKWSTSGGSIASDEQSSIADEISNHELETVASQHVELQQEMFYSQAIEQVIGTGGKEKQVIKSKPYVQNYFASSDGFLSSSALTYKPPEFSDHLKKVAYRNFNALLLRKLREIRDEEKNTVNVEEVLGMIEHRMELIENAQFEYNLTDQQLFNQELLTTLRVFKQEVTSSESGASSGILKVNKIIQELIGMLQLDVQRTAKFMCQFFRYLTDFDLIKCIASDSDSVAAQHILRARKLRLTSLHIDSKFGNIELSYNSELGDNSAGVNDDTHRRFEYETKVNNVDAFHLLRLFHVILQFYHVSRASISQKYRGSNIEINYDLLNLAFGTPPKNQYGRIRIREMIIDSPGMAEFLRWFCPINILIRCISKTLVDKPSLLSGIEEVEFDYFNADQLMENCSAPLIHLLAFSKWSDESVVRVLTAHRLSSGTGCPRTILSPCYGFSGKTVGGWYQLFKTWSRDFEAVHGKKGRRVTLSDDGRSVTLTLY